MFVRIIFILFVSSSSYAESINEYDLMNRYLSAALERFSDDKLVWDQIQTSQEKWKDYSESNCNAVRYTFGDGSYKNTAFVNCMNDETKKRTYTIWRSFLTFVDTTDPILPEPAL